MMHTLTKHDKTEIVLYCVPSLKFITALVIIGLDTTKIRRIEAMNYEDIDLHDIATKALHRAGFRIRKGCSLFNYVTMFNQSNYTELSEPLDPLVPLHPSDPVNPLGPMNISYSPKPIYHTVD